LAAGEKIEPTVDARAGDVVSIPAPSLIMRNLVFTLKSRRKKRALSGRAAIESNP